LSAEREWKFIKLSASANIFKMMSASAAIAIERECKIGEREIVNVKLETSNLLFVLVYIVF